MDRPARPEQDFQQAHPVRRAAGTGHRQNQVTRGQWVVRNIVQVDDKNRQVYFLGAGREPGEDPYQTHLYRANLDGTGLQLLTPEDSSHAVTMSANGDYFVDNYARPDQPGKSVLRSAKDGHVVRVLVETNAEQLLKTAIGSVIWQRTTLAAGS